MSAHRVAITGPGTRGMPVHDETLWLSQALMAELFQVTVPAINEHLKALYAEGELAENANVRKFRIVRTEGQRRVTRSIEHYSLDTILAVGYRVRSARGMQFRQWATERLREYLVKGFTMDDERLQNTAARAEHSPGADACPAFAAGLQCHSRGGSMNVRVTLRGCPPPFSRTFAGREGNRLDPETRSGKLRTALPCAQEARS
ncbi:MAG TPA: RhuM family protein [Longimicrobium sp.]|jgi:hypothetical protein